VDADQLAGAIRPSGTYRVRENIVHVSLVLVKDGAKLTRFQVTGVRADLDDLVSNIVKAISQAVEQLP
jgi:hypothetical protein